MYVVVTGGSGFLGSHVVEELLSQGHEVGIFGRTSPPASLLDLPGCRFVAGDLADLASVEAGLAGAEAVCHLGGVGDLYLATDQPYTAALLNVAGTVHVAEAALKHGARKLVYASTWEVYGAPQAEPIDERHPCNPERPYSITKFAGERLALAYELRDLPVIALRLGTAYGTRMRPNSVFSRFIGSAIAGEPMTILGSGQQTRQFTHASDIARAFALALESDVHDEAVNIVSPEATSIKRLAELIQSRYLATAVYLPAREGDLQPGWISSRKAKSLLGWEARVAFDDGLDRLIDALAAVPQAA